ncbi:putative cytochrome c-type biogenesis protein CcmF [Candidatus Vecturithrix granuli]|uniref:Putative cytochrome c-type biogenesis protein CcmF n=1 Tax=Vecturithrix granuli TaxID=1499967 RepID=A0A081C0A9_VECG1|nr:putative cytochrome c-type biogenesis protein CcmF [Candidatus Vecturithrix granuli]
MVHLAQFSLILALFCAGYALIACGISLLTRNHIWLQSAIHALNALAAMLTLATGLLLFFLLQRNFQLEYVANYTDVSLAPVYVISALWAGQRGSLLFLTWLLALCGAVGIRHYQKQVVLARYGFSPASSFKRELADILWIFPEIAPEFPYLVAGLSLTSGFFVALLVFATHPFQLLTDPPLNGAGLNPLLQNPYMAVHPPVLFLGYACFVVPFILSFAVLITGEIRKEWLRMIQQWVLAGWFLLGIGILLGAHWAYLELGWGGYWSWDPVENASLLPWISSTALLHTLILQQRKGMLVRWNLLLSVITFALCILGTFITRSGILQSVHAYAQSSTGMYFLLFLAVTGLCAVSGLAVRWRTLRGQSPAFSIASKEASLLLATQLLIGLGFAVFYGTMYPILSELFTGKHLVINQAFFNRISIPLGLLLLALMGICQWLSWKQGVSGTSAHRFILIIGGSATATGLFGILEMTHLMTLLACTLGILAGASLLAGKKSLLRPATFFHAGIAVIIVAIAVSSTYKQESDATLFPGESSILGDFRFEYVQLHNKEDHQKGIVAAEIAIYRKEKLVTILTPEQQFHGPSPENAQRITEVGWFPSLLRDVYVILAGWDEQHHATFHFIVYPMILWIWIGGYGLFSIGFLLDVCETRRVTHKQE